MYATIGLGAHAVTGQRAAATGEAAHDRRRGLWPGHPGRADRHGDRRGHPEYSAEVIAEAFFDLPPSRWLVPDQAARRGIFPGYFRHLRRARDGRRTVHTTPGRDAAALWIPAGEPAGPPDGYAAALAEVTGP